MAGKARRFYRNVAEDGSVAFYVKNILANNAAGTELTAADVQSTPASDRVRFRLNTVVDAQITYTGASLAGDITYTDGNANSIQEVLDIINGQGVGQTANRQWRAALGDVPPLYALTAADLLDQSAVVNTLLGLNHNGAAVNMDQSALATANDQWVGIGTERGTRKGSGLVQPDYFEDIPGTTGISGFASNTPDRGRLRAKQNDESVVVNRSSVVIDYIHVQAQFATTAVISIFDEDDDPTGTPQFQENLTNGAVAGVSPSMTGASGAFRFIGRPGKRIFVRFGGTGGYTAGAVTIGGYYEQGLRDLGRGA